MFTVPLWLPFVLVLGLIVCLAIMYVIISIYEKVDKKRNRDRVVKSEPLCDYKK